MTDMTETPRPVHPIPTDGGQAEINALVQASYVRRLSTSESTRLTALTWKPDPALEAARAILSRHPDLAGLVPPDTRLILEKTYEPARAAAVAAGRTVAAVEAVEAEVDRLATEYRETATDPYLTLDVDCRAAFRAAVKAGDFAAVVREWSAWVAASTERNTFASRRAAALQAFGRPAFADRRNPPSFVPELEDALGGGTIRETMPIIQR